jgi:hypothetical protein
MAKKILTVWFDQNGDLLDQWYDYGGYANPYGYKSEEGKDFHDRMEIVKFQEYARKNTRVILKSTVSGRKYSMYVDDFNDALLKKKVIDLHLEGTFRFQKKSSGQTVKLVLEDTP